MFLILTDQHVYKNLKEASLVVTGKSQVLVVIKFVIVNNFNSLLFSISLLVHMLVYILSPSFQLQ